jgi:hypothetical protein
MADEKVQLGTPTDAIVEAMEKVSDMEGVLIIWQRPEGGISCTSNGEMTVQQAIYLAEAFKYEMLARVFGDRD